MGWRSNIVGSEPDKKSVLSFLGPARGGFLVGGRKGVPGRGAEGEGVVVGSGGSRFPGGGVGEKGGVGGKGVRATSKERVCVRSGGSPGPGRKGRGVGFGWWTSGSGGVGGRGRARTERFCGLAVKYRRF